MEGVPPDPGLEHGGSVSNLAGRPGCRRRGERRFDPKLTSEYELSQHYAMEKTQGAKHTSVNRSSCAKRPRVVSSASFPGIRVCFELRPIQLERSYRNTRVPEYSAWR